MRVSLGQTKKCLSNVEHLSKYCNGDSHSELTSVSLAHDTFQSEAPRSLTSQSAFVGADGEFAL